MVEVEEAVEEALDEEEAVDEEASFNKDHRSQL